MSIINLHVVVNHSGMTGMLPREYIERVHCKCKINTGKQPVADVSYRVENKIK